MVDDSDWLGDGEVIQSLPRGPTVWAITPSKFAVSFTRQSVVKLATSLVSCPTIATIYGLPRRLRTVRPAPGRQFRLTDNQPTFSGSIEASVTQTRLRMNPIH